MALKRGADAGDPDQGPRWQRVEPTPSEGMEPTDGLVREPGRRRGPARAAEPVPGRARPIVIVLVVSLVLAIVAAGFGWLYARSRPSAVTTQTQVATRPPFELKLPLELGEYSRDANQGNSPNVSEDGKTTISATYSRGGQPAFILLLARPYDDGKVFMRDLNMNAVGSVEDGLCGISGDNQNDGCSLIRENTGILVLATVDLSRADLMNITHQAATAVGAP